MDFVSFEIAKKLKEKGFKEQCLAYYTNTNDLYFNYSHKAGAKYSDCYLSHNLMPKDSVSGKFFDAPTISQVLKWLRKEKKVHIGFGYSPRKKWRYVVMYMDDRFYNKPTLAVDGFLNIEQAALVGIEYVIDNLI